MHPIYGIIFFMKLISLGSFLLLLVSCASMGAAATDNRLTRMQQSPQYEDGIFVNRLPMSENDWGLVDFLNMLKDWWGGEQERTPKDPVAVKKLTAADFQLVSDDLSIRWMGHSSVLIEIEGKRVLTDPVWSDFASPVQFAGPQRFFEPVIPLSDLPAIDVVVISHDHYDHLDHDTIVALKDKVHFFVPLGIGAHLEAWGVEAKRIHELDWWEEEEFEGLRIVCTPARHFSGRSLTDRNETLWASWSILGKNRRVYFGGDSGLFHELEEIGERLGPFDVTMLDSGAYNERWPDVHMGPEQAVMAHRALRGKVLLPIHWGLFQLSIHAWTEPAERMRLLAQKDGDAIAQPRPGEAFTMQAPLPVAQWWPDVEWLTASESPVRSTHLDPSWVTKYSKPAAIADPRSQIPDPRLTKR